MKYKLKKREKTSTTVSGSDLVILKSRRKGFTEVHRMLWYKHMLEQRSWLNASD